MSGLGLTLNREESEDVTQAAFRVQLFAIVVSIAIHAAVPGLLLLHVVTGVTRLPPMSAAHSKPIQRDSGAPEVVVDVDLPESSFATEADGEIDPVGSPPRLAGGEPIARIDSHQRGKGGSDQMAEPALDLADRDDKLRLSPDLINHLTRDQLQRLRMSTERESWDDRRATTHPSELTFVLSGKGMLSERRLDAETLPSRGELRSRPARTKGGVGGVYGEAGEPGPLGKRVQGTPEAVPGRGVVSAREGIDHRSAAPIASERPSVIEGPVAVPARAVGQPRDDVDSEQAVATKVQALVHASTQGGLPGTGVGGTAGSGDPGAGGAAGPGSNSRPLGYGESDVFDYWTSDPRLLPYFRQIHARIEPLWANAFPKAAILELKQGTVILEFTIASDGGVSVSWPPARPSGIDEFDRNCANAVRRAAPFPPIPRDLGLKSLRVRAPFVASNPIIR